MIDSIISEIQRYRKIENDDNKRIIDFVNIIERASHDLKGVKMEQEIHNSNVVSIIELKLPKHLALNWYRLVHSAESKVDKTNKFPYLLEFLITERNALEYGMAELRVCSDKRYGTIHYVDAGYGNKCLIHNCDSHKTSECRSYLMLSVNERYALLKDKSACFSCLSPGHMLNECEHKIKCIYKCEKYHHSSLHPVTDVGGVHIVCHESVREIR